MSAQCSFRVRYNTKLNGLTVKDIMHDTIGIITQLISPDDLSYSQMEHLSLQDTRPIVPAYFRHNYNDADRDILDYLDRGIYRG